MGVEDRIYTLVCKWWWGTIHSKGQWQNTIPLSLVYQIYISFSQHVHVAQATGDITGPATFNARMPNPRPRKCSCSQTCASLCGQTLSSHRCMPMWTRHSRKRNIEKKNLIKKSKYVQVVKLLDPCIAHHHLFCFLSYIRPPKKVTVFEKRTKGFNN